jgi:hypothetical protein
MFDVKKAWTFIAHTVQERGAGLGWRYLMRKWSNARYPLKRTNALKEWSWRKYARLRRRGRLKRADNWLERHKAAKRKYAKLLAEKKAAQSGYDPATHTSVQDGRRVAAWMRGDEAGPNGLKIDWFQKFENHGWDGRLYSGWRSPEYSESLCYDICGAASCSGLCAGRASNHSQTRAPMWGAVDVINWSEFQSANNAVGGPFRNNLPNDRPHRSVSGY